MRLKKKCDNCEKRSLIVETCKCNNSYCLYCLPAFNHHCIFDYLEEKRNILRKENPLIISQKVDYI